MNSMYNSSPLLQPFILSALAAGVALAPVIVHDLMCGFLIREGGTCPAPRANRLSRAWLVPSPLPREPCSAPALPARQTPGAAGQGSFTECPKEGILLDISALWHPVLVQHIKLFISLGITSLNGVPWLGTVAVGSSFSYCLFNFKTYNCVCLIVASAET